MEENDIKGIDQMKGIMETKEAQDKLINEIIPRMKDRNSSFTNVVKLNNRKGDNALTAYIELWGNPIAEYEKDLKESKLNSGEIIDEVNYDKKLLGEELEFFKTEIVRLN